MGIDGLEKICREGIFGVGVFYHGAVGQTRLSCSVRTGSAIPESPVVGYRVIEAALIKGT